MYTAQDFFNAFKMEWENSVARERRNILDAYQDSKKWTNYMLGKECFLSRVMSQLDKNGAELEYRNEFYTLDALYVGGENLFKDNKMYPSQLQVLIEHEHGENIEEEMWKLIFWRSPLKVIIFYDYDEDEKKKNESKKGWLEKKRKKLESMLDKANEYFPENIETEYLFITGNRRQKGELPRWNHLPYKQAR